MNKKVIWILFFPLFLLQLISSLELGISPAHLNFEVKAGMQACQNMTVYADKSINIAIKDRWTGIEKSKNLKEYNLSSEDVDIKTVFPARISVSANKEKNIEVCFLPEKAGKFYGAILFESEAGYASVGSWIELNAAENGNVIPITGNVLGGIKVVNLLFIELFSTVIEILVLFILIKKINLQKADKKI